MHTFQELCNVVVFSSKQNQKNQRVVNRTKYEVKPSYGEASSTSRPGRSGGSCIGATGTPVIPVLPRLQYIGELGKDGGAQFTGGARGIGNGDGFDFMFRLRHERDMRFPGSFGKRSKTLWELRRRAPGAPSIPVHAAAQFKNAVCLSFGYAQIAP